MAETDVHRDELVAAVESLKARYASRDDVYVAGDLLVYYEEGNSKARFAPDVFVVFGVPKRPRRVYKLWEEGIAPAFVLELSSRGTWVEDAGNKKALCARFGVQEYFLFDTEADYLDPPLQGFRLEGGELRRFEPDEHGVFESKVLGLFLKLEDLRLRMIDVVTGEALLRPEQLERARREEREARLAAEAEVERLRAELAKREG
ncbi:MAG: Uma2 family endonuclease [Myxococcales bacterium]|nr:Uma2 family endonuclease [Myxococcales bacterium]